MKDKSKLSPKGAKIVAALGRFRDTIEAGIPIEQRYTVRQVRLSTFWLIVYNEGPLKHVIGE
jgi:hypothetical protein